MDQTKFKILFFPWLAHGHINPYLELAKRLPERNFTTYLCSTRVNLDSIKTTSSIQLVELHIPSSPEQLLPPEMLTTKNLPSNLMPNLIMAFQMSKSSFSAIMNSVKPDLLIYDLFQPWASKIASLRNIPSVLFTTSGATTFSYNHHTHTMGPGSPFPYQAIYLLDHERVGRAELLARVRKYSQDADADADAEEFAFGNFKRSNDIILVKSSRVVEDKYIGYLSVLCKKQIVPTGPLVVHDNDEEHSEAMSWLSDKNKCSTVYISFGSEYFLSKEQIAEIAKGLQLCKVDFLWVIRFPFGEKNPASIEEALPVGFLETVKERGKVIEKWAPQTKILAHPSVGGFVSHCGWSSITESMYFGVPVIGMPMKVEQPINARLAVEAGVGVEVQKDNNGNYVGDEVARAINKVMKTKEFYEGLRVNARRLSQKMKENEEREANETAEQLLRICMKNKKTQQT